MDVRCPHCGDGLWVEVDHDGTVMIECDSTSCGATWDRCGKTVRTPEMFRAEIAELSRCWSR